MAGQPLNYSLPDIPSGPADVWFNVAAPTNEVTLVYNSATKRHTPDATENASAVNLGLIESGVDVSLKSTLQSFSAHQLTSPYRDKISQDEVMISPKGALQVQSFDLLAILLQGTTASTPSGKKKLTGGGLTGVTYRTCMVIWSQPEDVTKYVYLLLYRAICDSGVGFTLTNNADGKSDLTIHGRTDVTRALGDQVYQLVRST